MSEDVRVRFYKYLRIKLTKMIYVPLSNPSNITSLNASVEAKHGLSCIGNT